jgi:DNA-binding CsgD family transcriptional regulator
MTPPLLGPVPDALPGHPGLIHPRLTEAVGILEDAVMQPATFADAMERAGRALGFDHFALVYSEIGKSEFIASDQTMDGLQAYAREGWIETDYRAATVGLAAADELYVDHRAVPEKQRLRSAIYNELYLAKRMSAFAGWRTSLAGAEWIFSLARGADRGQVRDEEESLVRAFMPYAKRTALMARAMREARAAGMADGLAAGGLPCITLDEGGHVLHMTPAAAALLGDDFGVRCGQLHARHPESARELSRLVAAAGGRLSEGVLPGAAIRRMDGRKPVSIQPLPLRGLGLDALPGARLLLFLIDLDRKGGAALADLQRLFGLTRAEAEVAVRLAAGEKLGEIAAGRKVALETVRVQLKGVLRKMDAGRQSDVVRIVDRLSRHAS